MDIRKAEDRGLVDFGWLQSAHTFSFGHYYDEKHMGYADLRVINDDVVAPAKGFDTHPHKNMEIVTYVLSGVLEHKDSMGNTSQIRAGDVQRMSAGTGVQHSEYNASPTDPVHLLQIWILPQKLGGAPSYEQTFFAADTKRNTLKLIGSQDGRDGSITIAQDVNMYAAILDDGHTLDYAVPSQRAVWVHVARGNVTINGVELHAGDAVSLSGEDAHFTHGKEAEILLFDMAA